MFVYVDKNKTEFIILKDGLLFIGVEWILRIVITHSGFGALFFSYILYSHFEKKKKRNDKFLMGLNYSLICLEESKILNRVFQWIFTFWTHFLECFQITVNLLIIVTFVLLNFLKKWTLISYEKKMFTMKIETYNLSMSKTHSNWNGLFTDKDAVIGGNINCIMTTWCTCFSLDISLISTK